MGELNALVVVAGPTGSGKSALALRLAEEFGGEIVNCDSIQIYRHFNLGAAKLSLEERRGIPHHLLDAADPGERFTAGEYGRRARSVIREIAARGRLPVVVGGTGFYMRALLEGLFAGPAADAPLRNRLLARERRRAGSLHRLLGRLDPEAAARIHANDLNKTMRALEVRLLGNRPITEFFREGREALTGFRVLKLVLDPPRRKLNRRLDERMAWMFAQGLIEETRAILDRGFAETLKPFESLGYRQAVQFLRGELTREEALVEAQTQTRRYAKRQVTWFRRETDAMRLEGFGFEPEVERQAIEAVSAFYSEGRA